LDFLADFHVHSRFSRATSRDLSLKSLHQAALEKGIAVVGTGDFTHPAWMEEIRETLEEAEEGLFRLRGDLAREAAGEVPSSCSGQVRFLLTAEISSIYKRDDRVRKVHNLLFAPTLEAARAVAGRLERIGNIASDGRPILGLDSRDLLEIVREASPGAFLVPAHIWTPWFSVLGSRSGFDSLEACFGDLAGEIFCVETGLSSDPAMNWRLTALDRFTLISNSDAHSADKLGREANRLACGLSFPEIREALRRGRAGGFLGTVEFFPEQGKYHLDGHRKCACRLVPAETLERGGLCPVCGKNVTVGVMHRVEALADRPEGARPEGALPCERLISLAEVVGEVKGAGPGSQGVRTLCRNLVQRLGPELGILSRVPLEELRREGGPLLEEAVRRMRSAEVLLEAGYDGEFGVVRLFRPEERDEMEGKGRLAGLAGPEREGGGRTQNRPGRGAAGAAGCAEVPGRPFPGAGGGRPGTRGDPGEARPGADAAGPGPGPEGPGVPGEHPLLRGLNPEQREAVLLQEGPLLIVAGPGTGKTHTLTRRIAWMVTERGVPAGQVLAVTFTQRAAREMGERLGVLLGRGPGGAGGAVQVKTFRALGADLLRESCGACGVPGDFHVLGREDSLGLLRKALPGIPRQEADRLLDRISLAKKDLLYPEEGPEAPEDGRGRVPDAEFLESYTRYQQVLREYGAVDLDDLVSLPARALERVPGLRDAVRRRFRAVCVDEYQDVNHAQVRLLRLICPEGARDLCAIGDPHQAIYGFRGASPAHFMDFEKDFPGCRRVRLVRNYRSTERILSASVHMLSRGLDRGDAPRLTAWARGGERVLEVELATEKSEAIFIAQTIEALLGGTDSLSLYADRVPDAEEPLCSGFGDIAVLFRLNAMGPGLERALAYQGVPCQGAVQAGRWQGKGGRALLALLRWRDAPGDRLSLEQIQAAVPLSPERIRGELEGYRSRRLPPGASLEEWVAGLPGLDWIPFGEDGWKEPWGELVRAVASHRGDGAALIRELALRGEADFQDRRAQKVTLTTLHAAKGLEFPVVFIAGCEHGVVPWESGEPRDDPLEERRLFYVGMTRACRRLYLTRARSRFLHGERGSGGPSAFLADLPPQDVERVRRTGEGGKPRPRGPEQPPLFPLD